MKPVQKWIRVQTGTPCTPKLVRQAIKTYAGNVDKTQSNSCEMNDAADRNQILFEPLMTPMNTDKKISPVK